MHVICWLFAMYLIWKEVDPLQVLAFSINMVTFFYPADRVPINSPRRVKSKGNLQVRVL